MSREIIEGLVQAEALRDQVNFILQGVGDYLVEISENEEDISDDGENLELYVKINDKFFVFQEKCENLNNLIDSGSFDIAASRIPSLETEAQILLDEMKHIRRKSTHGSS